MDDKPKLFRCGNPNPKIYYPPLLERECLNRGGVRLWYWFLDVWWGKSGYNLILHGGTALDQMKMGWERKVLMIPHPGDKRHDNPYFWLWQSGYLEEGDYWAMRYAYTSDQVEPGATTYKRAYKKAAEVIVPHHFFNFH